MKNIRSLLPKREFKLSPDGLFLGVCSGFAYYINTPVWIVRLTWTLSLIYFGVGVIPYLILWLILPYWDEKPRKMDD